MKLAVLGLGSAGRRHATNLVQLGHEVLAFDPDAAARSVPPGVVRVTEEEAAVNEAEAVVIATPSGLHSRQVLPALAAGKHVLVEKPLATSVLDAERIVETAAAAGTVCAVAMNLRFHRAIAEVKRLVEESALGKILLAEAYFGYDLRAWRPGTDYRRSYSARSELGGGIVFDAIHELDYLLWLLGPAVSVTAETAQLSDLEVDVEDVALAAIRFRSGTLASVSLNFFEPAYRRGYVVVGSDAVARWAWDDQNLIVTQRGGSPRLLDVRYDLAETYVAVLSDFVDSIHEGRPARVPAAEGLAATRLADAVKRAATEGRRMTLERE